MTHRTDESKQTVSEVDLEPIPLEVIEKYRITVDEIKQLDRFADYSAGQSNKVRIAPARDFHFFFEILLFKWYITLILIFNVSDVVHKKSFH